MKDKSLIMLKKEIQSIFKEVLSIKKMELIILKKTIKNQYNFIKNLKKIFKIILQFKNIKISFNFRLQNIKLILKVIDCNNFIIINRLVKTLIMIKILMIIINK